MDGAGVNGELSHTLPVEVLTRVRHLVIPVGSPGHALGQVRRVSSDAGSNHALDHVSLVGQPDVLGGCDVAQVVGTGGGTQRAADCGSDMVIAGRNISD